MLLSSAHGYTLKGHPGWGPTGRKTLEPPRSSIPTGFWLPLRKPLALSEVVDPSDPWMYHKACPGHKTKAPKASVLKSHVPKWPSPNRKCWPSKRSWYGVPAMWPIPHGHSDPHKMEAKLILENLSVLNTFWLHQTKLLRNVEDVEPAWSSWPPNLLSSFLSCVYQTSSS